MERRAGERRVGEGDRREENGGEERKGEREDMGRRGNSTVSIFHDSIYHFRREVLRIKFYGWELSTANNYNVLKFQPV